MQIGVEDSENIFMTMMLKIHKFKKTSFHGFFPFEFAKHNPIWNHPKGNL